MTRPPIEEIEARLKAATPGPWDCGGNVYNGVVHTGDVWVWSQCSIDPETGASEEDTRLLFCSPENGTFIAAAPTDIAALLAYVEELEAQLESQIAATSHPHANCDHDRVDKGACLRCGELMEELDDD